MRILRLEARPLTVPLIEPFVIATGRMETTRAVLVVARLSHPESRIVTRGIGEAAALPPVTKSDQGDLLSAITRAHEALAGQSFTGHSELAALLDSVLADDPVARAGAEAALLDAWARLEHVPVHTLLGSEPLSAPFSMASDITIPIGEPTHMGELAAQWREQGFHHFKVKVGRNVDDDARALEHIAKSAPGCWLRLDGNEGFTAPEAMSLVAAVRKLDAQLECFEQPCLADDLEGMARVTALAGCPVIADESVKTLADLDRVIAQKAATGVNLKLVKHGGLVEAGRIGRAAKRAGLKLMVGAMVETRLGLTAMAHNARALGEIDLVDLDTALLLKWDAFAGGYEQVGPTITLVDGEGFAVSEAPPMA